MGLLSLERRRGETRAPSLLCEDTAAHQLGRQPCQSAGTLILDVAASRIVRNKCLVCKPLGLWHFVMAPKTETVTERWGVAVINT